ncbi:GAF and ANTAR domain-containing protein [Amycolatopsis sp. OK19-0408]|uniref:GAF and ANTAR domain-containing protein n=1 Tax=Amycolatopsis iheyensis TaxID=2945988 RepID=A0A9X2NQQ3_9PSEU|nr:GAF and ANTAR domain-containing protein [Amycolatopsis iheyensis]MCR6490770.1 GAF and ANTAR domain-containing protein [Amycolatopsis iheyensis]
MKKNHDNRTGALGELTMADTSESRGSLVGEREGRVSRTFVRLADTLVADFDVADFLAMLTEQCAALLNVGATGVILVDPAKTFQLAATSSQRAEHLELFAIQTEDGPCIDCARTGAPVFCADLTTAKTRWPRFTAAAHECGFRAAHALPMRLRDEVIGVLTLLDAEPGAPEPEDIDLGQALADVATIGILQQRTIEQRDVLAAQLQNALHSRVVIEQAKGALAERGGISADEAFQRLRSYARSRHLRLTDLAGSVLDGSIDPVVVLADGQS